ncbi:tail completion protein [Microcystis phage Mae-JY09]
MDAVATGLYSRLSGDTTGGTSLAGLGMTAVYQGLAPQSAVYPYVVFQLADGEDRRVLGARATIWQDWIVRAWDVGDSHKRAKRLADRIDALLDEGEASLTVAGYTVLSVRRIRALPDTTEHDENQGLLYRASGARYEVEVR